MSYYPLLFELVLRDIKIKYRRSILGLLWTVLNPLFMMVILYLVFSKLFRFEIENYAIYILSGQIIFNYFQTATTDAMTSIVVNGSLLRKVYIKKQLFVCSKILSGVVNLLASIIALLLIMLVTGVPFHKEMILCIIPITLLLVLSMGVGLLLAAVTVKFRDILHLYSVFCTGLFYLTPVIYPMNILPESIEKVVKYNPVTCILTMFRDVMIKGTLPTLENAVWSVVSAAAVLLIGVLIFVKRQKYFVLDL